MNGIINLFKPAGMTSFKAVSTVRRLTGCDRCGHAGTLDPEATGILPVLIGKATKVADMFLECSKTYIAEMEFGYSTDTQDIWGTVTDRKDASHVTKEALEETLRDFTGNILQTPPKYSALKIGGTPAYKLARNGQEPELKPRKVSVYSIKLLDYTFPKAIISVECGRGTYIRTLCNDIAQSLGTLGVMSALERSRYGMLDRGNAITADSLEQLLCGLNGTEKEAVLKEKGILFPISSMLENYPRIVLGRLGEADYLHGRPVSAGSDTGDGLYAVYTADGRLIGTANVRDGFLKSDRFLFEG